MIKLHIVGQEFQSPDNRVGHLPMRWGKLPGWHNHIIFRIPPNQGIGMIPHRRYGQNHNPFMAQIPGFQPIIQNAQIICFVIYFGGAGRIMGAGFCHLISLFLIFNIVSGFVFA
jgi:hypothetical protein